MSTVYDSGWIAAASGSIQAGVSCREFSTIRVIYAASGTNGAASVFLGWQAGLNTPVPWRKQDPGSFDPPCFPLITGTFSISAPAANSTSIYRIGVGQSGSGHIDDIVPDVVNITASAGASSWARVIVEGR